MGLLEEWRPVVGYEGLYEVSDQGRVRSLDRVVCYRDGRSRSYSGVVLVQTETPYGYLVVTLSRGKRSKRVRLVHALVMESFEGPRPPKYDVCHGDNDKRNNALTNLRYDTREGNLQDSKRLAAYCGRGHPISGVNEASYQRRCLACSRASNFARGQGRPVTQELTDAIFREIIGEELPGDAEIVSRKHKKRRTL